MDDAINQLAGMNIEGLQGLPHDERVQLLAESLEFSSLGDACRRIVEEKEELPRVRAQLREINERLQLLEAYVEEAPAGPELVPLDDPAFLRFRAMLAHMKELNTGKHWETPSRRKARARQLRTLHATAEKLDVQRQAHWEKVHEVYAKIAAMAEVCDEDGGDAEAAEKLEEDEHTINMDEMKAIERTRTAAARRLQEAREAKKRKCSASTVAMDENVDEDLFS